MSRPHVLVVEDERNLALGIRENLEAEGYRVDVAASGEEALAAAARESYDLALVDVMLPGIDGLEVCRRLRADRAALPVLFLTARGAVEDRIRGLEAGGDDYLAKPFALRELLLRAAALLRRGAWYGAHGERGRELEFGGNRFDFESLRGKSWNGELQILTPKEAMVLKALAERAGAVVSRDEILEKVWGADSYPTTRTIDNFLLRLRKRFERDPERPRHLHTVRGVGYRLTIQPES